MTDMSQIKATMQDLDEKIEALQTKRDKQKKLLLSHISTLLSPYSSNPAEAEYKVYVPYYPLQHLAYEPCQARKKVNKIHDLILNLNTIWDVDPKDIHMTFKTEDDEEIIHITAYTDCAWDRHLNQARIPIKMFSTDPTSFETAMEQLLKEAEHEKTMQEQMDVEAEIQRLKDRLHQLMKQSD